LLEYKKQKKADFSSNILNLIDRGMDWKFLSAKGTLGSILVGFKSLTFEIVNWQQYEYCVSLIVKNQLDNFMWRLMVVYGSPYEEKKMDFICELHLVVRLARSHLDWEGGGGAGGIKV
jgi:hypothetical protein